MNYSRTYSFVLAGKQVLPSPGVWKNLSPVTLDTEITAVQ
jgi:hypothetical protein